MDYVSVRATEYGFHLDPTAYTAVLPSLESRLPAGAWEFISDPDHFDFSSDRCVKDLRLASVSLTRCAEGAYLEVRLEKNPFQHGSDLVIAYSGVREFTFTGTPGDWPALSDDAGLLGDFQLDEVLPVDGGCTHEVQMTHGRLFVTCRDLQARWQAG